MRRVLATDFGIWPVFKNMEQISDAMLASVKQRSQLANYLLLYDQIVIPTGNLQILPVLRLMLGEEVFEILIRSKAIVLARYDQWFGYLGNGAGLNFFAVHQNPDKTSPAPNLFNSYFLPLDEAIDVALLTTNPQSPAHHKSHLKKLLSESIIQLQQLENGKFKNECYQDILGSPYLRDMFQLRNPDLSLNKLLGLKTNELTTFNAHSPREFERNPEIQSVLRVAFENFLLRIGQYSKTTEITGDESSLSLLKAKGQRAGYALEGETAFAKIQEVSGVPDIGEAFANKLLTPHQLLDLRYSKHSQALRDWFAIGSPTDSAKEIVQRYVDTLGRPSWIESIPAKILRFAVTTGIGLLGPMAGAVSAAVDTFVLNDFFPDSSPRLFLKKAKVLLVKPDPIPKPEMKGRDRNRICHCGSNRKFKKCCGR